MKLLATFSSIALLCQTISAMAPQKTTFNDDGSTTVHTTGPEASYPDHVIAPTAEDGPGPASDPLPKPHTFSNAALLQAYHYSMKAGYTAGDGATYPKAWTGAVNGVSGLTEFPILTSGAPYTGGDPGRFRLLRKPDGTFVSIGMHKHSSPSQGPMNAFLFFGSAKTPKRDLHLTRRAAMEEDFMLMARDAFNSWLNTRKVENRENALTARYAAPQPRYENIYARDMFSRPLRVR